MRALAILLKENKVALNQLATIFEINRDSVSFGKQGVVWYWDDGVTAEDDG